jgi:hypothetical protein
MLIVTVAFAIAARRCALGSFDGVVGANGFRQPRREHWL